MEKTAINCIFQISRWRFIGNIYTCKIYDQEILNQTEMEFIGEYLNGKTYEDVEAISFKNCTFSKVPQGLTNIFPNLKVLQINKSNLNHIAQEDLKEYANFLCLSFVHTEIEYLHGDLFAEMKNLKVIWLTDNKELRFIEPTLLDGLNNLDSVNFRNSSYVNKCFDVLSGTATLQEIKHEIHKKSSQSPWRRIFEMNEKLKTENEELKCVILTHNNTRELKKIVEDENCKDFTVFIEGKEFKVHKLLLADHSPVLAELIDNKIVTDRLNLMNISAETFQEIYNFIYTEATTNSEDINFIHLFAAAGRLKMEKLKNFAAEKLMTKINDQNAHEISILSIEYKNENLYQRSFEVIKGIIDSDNEG